MKIISNSALRAFAAQHPQAQGPLQGWRRVIEKNRFDTWAALKAAFNTVDKVGDLVVFNVGGNKYRLVVEVQYQAGLVWVKFVGTHAQYDRIDVETVNEY